MPENAKQVIVRRPGGYQTSIIDQTPIEPPAPGHIQVEVKACGINFADIARNWSGRLDLNQRPPRPERLFKGK
ncbi:MAG TPA: hypothetical protein ENF92_00270 [Desulfobacteraceae bacterium]|nr:hypothetical protein [Desulfobacteraceae bacterium]